MTVLDKIIANKRKEVAERKESMPVSKLQQSEFFNRTPVSLSAALKQDQLGIIAEFKRKSPSKGMINEKADVEEVTKGYISAGVTALSVLTDAQFFGGSSEDLIRARKVNDCPILRKDFIIDEYQVIEAKSIGADVILLIAAALDPEETKRLASFAHSLGLEVLLEVHNEKELNDHLCAAINVVGVNNRNLKDFSVDITLSEKLFSKIPGNFVKISESGINSPEAVVRLKQQGYQGFLMGEHFMRTPAPHKTCEQFIFAVNTYLKDSSENSL